MKNRNIIIVAIIAVAMGLLLGYFLFRSAGHEMKNENTDTEKMDEVWTCSMHPQIRQPEPGQCPICGMDLIPASQATSTESEYGFQMSAEAVKMANIQTTQIGIVGNSIGTPLKLNGKIQSDETRAASIVTHIPGRIEQLFVSFTGEQINKGQKIARIYSPDLITAQRELIEAKKIADISPGLLDAAKSKLRNWKIGEQTINNILSNGRVQNTFTIYADHSGVVTNRRATVGDYLSTGEVLFDVNNLNSIWAVFEVYESDLPMIKHRNKIEFTTPSMPNKKFAATISFIDPIVNPQSRVATIRAEVNNNAGHLKPEMFITGRINNAQKPSTLSVPKTAVLWTGTRSVVYLKVPNVDIPTFEYKEITLGESAGDSYLVNSGLNFGDEVVTNGAFVIDAAAQLNNRASMMNKNVMSKSSNHAKHLPDYTTQTPIAFKKQIEALSETYLSLKDALVLSDKVKSKNAAQAVLKSLDKVDMALVKGDAHIYWMQQLKAMKLHANEIAKAGDIKKQREQFNFLSQSFINTIKVFGITKDTLYVQHCPMADNDNGADWISKNLKIQNPYFGEEMMTCGTTQDTISKDYKNPIMQQQSNIRQGGHNHN